MEAKGAGEVDNRVSGDAGQRFVRILLVGEAGWEDVETVRGLRRYGYEPLYACVSSTDALRSAIADDAWEVVLMPAPFARRHAKSIGQWIGRVPWVLCGRDAEPGGWEEKDGPSPYGTVPRGDWFRLGALLDRLPGRDAAAGAAVREAGAQNRISYEVPIDVKHMMPRFQENRLKDFELLDLCCKQEDFRTVVGLIRNVRSIFQRYGFTVLADMSRAVEKSALEKDAPALRGRLDTLRDHFQRMELRYV